MGELKRTWMCGHDVHKGTQIIGWIMVVLNCMSANLLGVLVAGLMLWGLDKKRPEFYLGYLILQIICIVIFAICLVFFPFLLLLPTKDGESFLPFVLFIEIFMIPFLILYIYPLLIVPLRSYRLLKEEVYSQPPQVTATQAPSVYNVQVPQYAPQYQNPSAPPLSTKSGPPPTYDA